jgi:type IV fimbrial biogenesis protein FimT
MRSAQRGFTLAELMMVLVVMAILGSMAVPAFREYTRASRVTASQNDLTTALNFARSEALKRSLPVTVCPSSNGTSCLGNTAGWVSGWIAFTDNTGTIGVVNTGTNGDEVLQSWSAPGGDIQVSANSTYIQYQPVGSAVFSGGSPATFDLKWSGCKGKAKRHLSITLVGSPRSELLACP